MLYGIDISHHNMQSIKNHALRSFANNDFVIMKATEGIGYRDPALNMYYNIIHGVGDGQPDDNIQYGFYHYARPERHTPKQEADYFLKVVGHHAGHALYALDFEGTALTIKDAGGWAYQWCERVYEVTKVRPVIYLQKSAIHLFKLLADNNYGLWVAAWGKDSPKGKIIAPWKYYALWQYNGVQLDGDVFNGDKVQWRKYCRGDR